MTDTAVDPAAGLAAPSGPVLAPELAPNPPGLPTEAPALSDAPMPTPTEPTATDDVVPTLAAAPAPLAAPSDEATDEPLAELALAVDDAAMPTLPSSTPGATPTLAAAPVASTPRTEPTNESFAEVALAVDDASMPTLPETSSAPAKIAEVGDLSSDEGEPSSTDDSSDHPLGHLMPGKSKPSEASRKAAELREARKKKSRKIKIGVAIVFLALAAVAGPPGWSWLTNAINEAGSTSVEEPAN